MSHVVGSFGIDYGVDHEDMQCRRAYSKNLRTAVTSCYHTQSCTTLIPCPLQYYTTYRYNGLASPIARNCSSEYIA